MGAQHRADELRAGDGRARAPRGGRAGCVDRAARVFFDVRRLATKVATTISDWPASQEEAHGRRANSDHRRAGGIHLGAAHGPESGEPYTLRRSEEHTSELQS